MHPGDGRRNIRVFVASPSDVRAERDVMPSIVNELNHILRALIPDKSVTLELVRWETHSYPGMGRPQGIINDQIGEFDIFIGILWQRFGTPTGKASSGTEEEFQNAYAHWLENGTPHILLYFNAAQIGPPRTKEAAEQLMKLVEFRRQAEEKGLTWEYNGSAQFADTVRPHLISVLGQLIRASEAPRPHGTGAVEVRADPAPAGQKLSGERVRIVDIDSADAHYGKRDTLIGKVGTLRSHFPAADQNGWYTGAMEFDDELTRSRVFFRVQVERVD